MKFSLILIFLVSIAASKSHAFTLSEKVIEVKGKGYSRVFEAKCSAAENFCFSMCWTSWACDLVVDSCDSCVTDSDLQVRSMFLNSHQIYEAANEKITEDSLFYFLTQNKHQFLSSSSVLNIYSDPQNPKDLENINNNLSLICEQVTGIKAKNPVILMGVSVDQKIKPAAILCEVIEGDSAFFPLKINSNYFAGGNGKYIYNFNWETDFFSKDPVKLKMSSSLSK